MEKSEKPSSHGEQDQLFDLHLLANVVVQDSLIDMDAKNPNQSTGLSDTKLTYEPRQGHVSRSGHRISARDHPISVTRKVTENCGSNQVSDTNSNDVILHAALVLMDMLNDKCEAGCKEETKYVAILQSSERKLDESIQLNEKRCISETTAQGSSRKRKFPGGEMQKKARKRMKGGPHMCRICGKSFATGVQLGGHKRAHFVKEPAEPVKCWSIRKCVDSELHFYLTIVKND